ncbi:aspartic proteinase 36-like [Apium graveolens]|uniref:aspartic proteinase 36-like n=1 Tax=Apium graveolens TaxID=4045 RepID=UPI003D79CEA2
MAIVNFAITLLLLEVFLLLALAGVESAATLSLERRLPENVEPSELLRRDSSRHHRKLAESYDGVIDFTVDGTSNPYITGIYYTRIKLGSPPKEYYVQIDTGSDVLWVGCNSCHGCPTSTNLNIRLEMFDPTSSSTASVVSCLNRRCDFKSPVIPEKTCPYQAKQCKYTLEYGDGSTTSGYYVEDVIHIDRVVGSSVISNITAPIVFGCSTSESGRISNRMGAVNGIFGFGQQGLSVVSQLFSQEIAPDSFSHCLKGGDSGGGILVFGQIEEPNLVYTPLLPSRTLYFVNLLSISVNGLYSPSNPSVHSISSNEQSLIDSGTTLAYLEEKVYDHLVNAITQAVSKSVPPLHHKGFQCYIIRPRLSAIFPSIIIQVVVSRLFPSVTLNFAGGASMIVTPEDYLLQQITVDGALVRCLGFQKSKHQGFTILGDIVLKDRVVIYDLGRQRIGWADYDCSLPVNVSMNASSGTTRDYVTARSIGGTNSIREDLIQRIIPISIIFLLLHISIF